MLKPHELFIGAIVNYNNGEEMLSTKLDSQDLAWIEKGESYFNKSHSPIPLTPEILTDWCGWDEHYHTITLDRAHKQIGFAIWKSPSKNSFEIRIHGRIIKLPHIQYLHQLQAIYALLTGEVMEIKLPKNQ